MTDRITQARRDSGPSADELGGRSLRFSDVREAGVSGSALSSLASGMAGG